MRLGYCKAVAVLRNHCYGHTDSVLEPSCLPFPTTDPLLFVSVSQNLAHSERSKNILWPGLTLSPSGHQHGRCCFSSTEVTGGQRGEMVYAGSCGTSADFLRDRDEGPLTLWPHALAFSLLLPASPPWLDPRTLLLFETGHGECIHTMEIGKSAPLKNELIFTIGHPAWLPEKTE